MSFGHDGQDIRKAGLHTPKTALNAYRRGDSTEDAINMATEHVKNSEHKYVVGIFVDISGAFDNLWWLAFFQRLKETHYPRELYKCFRNYCQDRYATSMRVYNDKTDKGMSPGIDLRTDLLGDHYGWAPGGT